MTKGRPQTALNFALLCDGPSLDPWIVLAVRQAVGSGFARLTCVIATGELDAEAVEAVDDICALSPAAPARISLPISSDAQGHFLQDLDFVLASNGFEPVSASADIAARMGIWRFEIANGPTATMMQRIGDLIFRKEHVVECALVRMDSPKTVLHRGYYAIIPQSVGRTGSETLGSAGSWLGRVCADIVLNGARPGEPREGEPLPRSERSGFSRARTAIANRLKMQFRYRLQRQQWNVGIVKAPIAVVAGLEGASAQADALSRTVWMPEIPRHFFADPFGFRKKDGTIQILAERVDWRKPKGEIVGIAFDGTTFSRPHLVLDAPTHLSYPFLLEGPGDRLFIPEHSAGKNVSAFSIDDDCRVGGKQTWIDQAELLDCTFLERDGRRWMFACVDSHAKNSELHLFFADEGTGAWRPHPLNPVKSNVRSARPAGSIFAHNGRLYRPSQDCSTHYGRAVVVNEILTLTDTQYLEQEVSEVLPLDEFYNDGLHTISAVDEYTLIDGSRQKWAWSR